MSRRSKRKIVVDGIEWSYIIGRSMVVARMKDSNVVKKIFLNQLTGLDWNEIERGCWKRYFHIYPSQIANWLSGIPLPEEKRR